MSETNFNNTTLLPATQSGTETLTNKTLTSPTINTGILTSNTVTTSLVPTSNDGAALGSTSNQFSDLFLAEGGVINWDNGDATLTQVGDVVTLAGADLKITTPGTASTSVATIDGTQTLTNKTLSSSTNTIGPNSQVYASTITWAGVTAPSGATSHAYNWSRIGNTVWFSIVLTYATAGTANTGVTIEFPVDLPAPLEWVSLTAALDKLYGAFGTITALTASGPANTAAAIRRNSADTNYEFVLSVGGVGARQALVSGFYFTA